MKGFPKKIATGQDLFNCLALVQTGELPATELSAAIEAIEEREYITVPVLEVSEDRKTVVINGCAEATTGAKVQNGYSTTISAAAKLEAATLEGGTTQSGKLALDGGKGTAVLEEAGAAEEDTSAEMQAERLTVTLSRALPEDATVLKIAAAVSPYDVLGVTADEVKSIKGVLKNYE